MSRMRLLGLLLALLASAAAAQQAPRFEIDLGAVDIESKGWREYKLPPLPEADIAFGFRLTAPEGLSHLPKAMVRMTLTNELDQVVFDVADELANFVRAESTRAWFLYQRGIPGQAPGPDGGWGTYAHPRKSGSYRMTVETLQSNVTMTKFTVRLMGVGGGAK
jgi:hypothetical protein